MAAGSLESLRVAESWPWAVSRAVPKTLRGPGSCGRLSDTRFNKVTPRVRRVCSSAGAGRGRWGRGLKLALLADVARASTVASLVRAAGPGAMAALGGDGLRLLSVSRPERQAESTALGGPGPGLCCWVSVFSCLSLACSYVGSLYVWKSELPRCEDCAPPRGWAAGGAWVSRGRDHADRWWPRAPGTYCPFHRDHPAVIKRRFTSVLVVSSLSPLCVLLWRELTGIQVRRRRGKGQRDLTQGSLGRKQD